MKVGITGHQELENADWVRQEILRVLYVQTPPLVGITSLAVGADQIFAQAVLDCGGDLQVIIPMEGYSQSLDADGLKEYEQLIAQASSVQLLPEAVSEEESYFAAGKRIVELSDVLIAVWDGKPAAGLGGTGDVVKYAKLQGAHYLHINPETKEVSQHC